MEAVPITNCSSTLPSLSKVVLPSKRLCRNLFGPVDHGQIASILDAELNHDVKEKSEEWCFDFSEGTPLKNGRLSWEEVDASNERSETRKSEKAPDGEARVPDLHDESCTFESNDDLKTCRLRRTSLTTTSKTVSSPVSSDSTVTEMKSPSIEVRKRKKPYRTITGKFYLLSKSGFLFFKKLSILVM